MTRLKIPLPDWAPRSELEIRLAQELLAVDRLSKKVIEQQAEIKALSNQVTLLKQGK